LTGIYRLPHNNNHFNILFT